MCNNHKSLGQEFPELGTTVIKFLRKDIAQRDILPKQPMFQQDMEHILDVIGIETEAALQRKLENIIWFQIL